MVLRNASIIAMVCLVGVLETTSAAEQKPDTDEIRVELFVCEDEDICSAVRRLGSLIRRPVLIEDVEERRGRNSGVLKATTVTIRAEGKSVREILQMLQEESKTFDFSFDGIVVNVVGKAVRDVGDPFATKMRKFRVKGGAMDVLSEIQNHTGIAFNGGSFQPIDIDTAVEIDFASAVSVRAVLNRYAVESGHTWQVLLYREPLVLRDEGNRIVAKINGHVIFWNAEFERKGKK